MFVKIFHGSKMCEKKIIKLTAENKSLAEVLTIFVLQHTKISENLET